MNEKENKKALAMKIVGIVLVMAIVIGFTLFITLSKPKPKDDFDTSPYTGKYNLTSISGHKDGIKASDYDYNYIYLGEDGYFKIANKMGKNKVETKGIWYVENDRLVLETSRMFGLKKSQETGNIQNGKITIINHQEYGDIELVLTKE